MKYCVSDFKNRRKRQISTSIHVDAGHYFIETYTIRLIINYALMFHIFLIDQFNHSKTIPLYIK